MKTFLALVVVFSGINLWAGPEDHIQAQTCYHREHSNYALPSVPGEICLENLSINPVDSTISIYSYFYPNLFSKLKVTSLIRKNEDFYSFVAEAFLSEVPSFACGNSETVKLIISGLVDFNGNGNIDGLNINVEQETNRDPCHFEPHQVIFNYK